METYTLDPRCWRVGRIFSRNPLIRRSDRIEALVTLIAQAVFLVTIPLAGIAGAAVYGARESCYAHEAHDRHTVMAMVTEVSGTGIDGADPSLVQARWPGADGERTRPLRVVSPAKVGDRIQIWVNANGDPVAAPTPTWRAVTDAVATVEASLLLVGFGLLTLVAGVRSRLDHALDAEWEREITCQEEDGGRTNQR